jgi:hypothetical protein
MPGAVAAPDHGPMRPARVVQRVVPRRCGAMVIPARVAMMSHQRSANSVPHHLPVVQTAAPAQRPPGRMRRPVTHMACALMRVPGAMMGMTRVVTAMGRSMLADVDPAMRRPGGRKGREGRRRRLLRFRRRRGRFGNRLVRRGRRLPGRGLLRDRRRLVSGRLLRRDGRCEKPEREGGTDEAGALHCLSPGSARRLRAAKP